MAAPKRQAQEFDPNDQTSVQSASSSEELAVGQPAGEQLMPRLSVDTPFVFQRTPVLHAANNRRFSTSTFLQGVLHTPSPHFSHLSATSSMDKVVESSAGEQQQQQEQEQEQQKPEPVVVDNFSHACVAHDMDRRALSTPQRCEAAGGVLDMDELQAQVLSHASCPGPLLIDGVMGSPQKLHPEGRAIAIETHVTLQGRANFGGFHQGIIFGQAGNAFAAPALSFRADADSSPRDNSCLSQQLKSLEGIASKEVITHKANTDFEQVVSSPVKGRDSSSSSANPVHRQHPLWLTFEDGHHEADFAAWMDRKCSKVCSAQQEWFCSTFCSETSAGTPTVAYKHRNLHCCWKSYTIVIPVHCTTVCLCPTRSLIVHSIRC